MFKSIKKFFVKTFHLITVTALIISILIIVGSIVLDLFQFKVEIRKFIYVIVLAGVVVAIVVTERKANRLRAKRIEMKSFYNSLGELNEIAKLNDIVTDVDAFDCEFENKLLIASLLRKKGVMFNEKSTSSSVH